MRSNRSVSTIIPPESGTLPYHSNPPPRSPSPSSGSSSSSSGYDEECTIGDYHHKGGRKTFPLVLHEVLEEVEQNGKSHIISWQPHGRCFRIHDSKAFCKYIMHNKFRQSKWSSFQRQLNLYGFIRYTKSGPDRGGYYHECFLRNRVKLSKKIQRTRVKGTKVRKASVVVDDEQPNFYAMPPLDGENTRKKNVTNCDVSVHGTDKFGSNPSDKVSYSNEYEMQRMNSAHPYHEEAGEHQYPHPHQYHSDYHQSSHCHQHHHEHYYGDRRPPYSKYYHSPPSPTSGYSTSERPIMNSPERPRYEDRPYQQIPSGPTRAVDKTTSPERTNMPRRVISNDGPSNPNPKHACDDKPPAAQADLEPYNYKLPEEENLHQRRNPMKHRPSWVAALDDWVLDFHAPDGSEESKDRKTKSPSSATGRSASYGRFTNRDISNMELNVPVVAKSEDLEGKIPKNMSF